MKTKHNFFVLAQHIDTNNIKTCRIIICKPCKAHCTVLASGCCSVVRVDRKKVFKGIHWRSGEKIKMTSSENEK